MNPETERFQFARSMDAVEERDWNGPFFEFRSGCGRISGECLPFPLDHSVAIAHEIIRGKIADVVNSLEKSHRVEFCTNSKACVKTSADAASRPVPA
jgi:hypothetical protein